MSLAPGDVVLVRTGTGRFWGEDGADHAKIAEHDSAGPDLEATKWLVEDQGAIMVGSDTSGYEVNPPPGSPGTGIPVHRYLLVDQGVHLGEFHYLEGLSQAGLHVLLRRRGQQDQGDRRGLRLAAAGTAIVGSPRSGSGVVPASLVDYHDRECRQIGCLWHRRDDHRCRCERFSR